MICRKTQTMSGSINFNIIITVFSGRLPLNNEFRPYQDASCRRAQREVQTQDCRRWSNSQYWEGGDSARGTRPALVPIPVPWGSCIRFMGSPILWVYTGLVGSYRSGCEAWMSDSVGWGLYVGSSGQPASGASVRSVRWDSARYYGAVLMWGFLRAIWNRILSMLASARVKCLTNAFVSLLP